VEVKRRRKSVEREDLRGEEQVRVGVLSVNVNPVNARQNVPSVSLDVEIDAEPKNNFSLFVNLI
tara:strand:+ start:194 stop:385 length:192 start_codon:yes stop_codon:yes gene_type:complete